MIRAKGKGMTEILDHLTRLAETFDLGRENLGNRLMDIATREILIHMGMEVDPDGLPWPALSQKYIEYKAEIAPQAPMAVLFGVMKTWEQIAGERFIESAIATMTYGLDPVARIEAIKFTEGGMVTGTSQPGRPFYALTSEAERAITDELGYHFGHAW